MLAGIMIDSGNIDALIAQHVISNYEQDRKLCAFLLFTRHYNRDLMNAGMFVKSLNKQFVYKTDVTGELLEILSLDVDGWYPVLSGDKYQFEGEECCGVNVGNMFVSVSFFTAIRKKDGVRVIFLCDASMHFLSTEGEIGRAILLLHQNNFISTELCDSMFEKVERDNPKDPNKAFAKIQNELRRTQEVKSF